MKLYDFGILVSIGLLTLVFLAAVGAVDIHDKYKEKQKVEKIAVQPKENNVE